MLQMLIGMVQGVEQDKRLASLCSVAIDVTTIMYVELLVVTLALLTLQK